MAIYKVNKKILLQEGMFDSRSLKDDGFVMNAMKNKNRHQIDPNNSVMGPNYNGQSNFERLAKNQNERINHSNSNDHVANNNPIGPVRSDPVVVNDRNMHNVNKYNQRHEDTMYAKNHNQHTDPFKPLPMNNTNHDQHAIDTPHTLIGH